MPSLREERLQERVAEIRPQLAKAREIAEKADAENRGMTPEEQKDFDAIMAKGREVSDAVKAHRHDQEVFAFARELSDNVIGGLSHDDLSASGSGSKSRRLSFKGMGTKVATQMLPDGMKSLAPSGAAVVGQEMKPDPVALGQPALSLLDVIPVTAHATTEFAYMRQTVRTNHAAVVAEGAVKPTSVYTVNKVPNSLVVVAHLSEGIPRFWLIDQVSLETFVSNELEYGLRLAVEAKVLADVNGTSGIQTQAYATSVLATLRKSLTKLETAGYTPGSLVIHATDWEGVKLALSSTNAIEHLALPYDRATRRLFGVPVVTSNAQAAGVGHAVATDSVALDTDTRGVDVQWSENATADSFGKNPVFARCESRYATSVFSPLGVVTLDLTA